MTISNGNINSYQHAIDRERKSLHPISTKKCKSCGQYLVKLEWTLRWSLVCDNGLCPMYRNPQGSEEFDYEVRNTDSGTIK
jgi:ssDNA-binding Zn-finger/Zn-ribbon topoisomerase 1